MAGGYLTARPLRELRPNGWFASLTSRGLGLPHFSRLTSLKARHAVPLQLTPSLLRPHSSPFKDSGRTQTSSFRAQSRNPCFPALQLGCCDYAQHDGMCRAPLPPSPTPFPVFPHPYDLTPHSSLLTPHVRHRLCRSVSYGHVAAPLLQRTKRSALLAKLARSTLPAVPLLKNTPQDWEA